MPLDVSLKFDGTQGVTSLETQSAGDESRRRTASMGVMRKAFSVSDDRYKISNGISQEVPVEFLSNFVAEVRTTELAVVGVGVSFELSNRAFYRVVAVDADGKRSGPSDYAAAPRPFIFSQPPAAATKGNEFQHPRGTIRSLGDLRMRIIAGRRRPVSGMSKSLNSASSAVPPG